MLNSSLNYTLLIILFQIIYVLVRLKEGRDKSGNFVLCVIDTLGEPAGGKDSAAVWLPNCNCIQ